MGIVKRFMIMQMEEGIIIETSISGQENGQLSAGSGRSQKGRSGCDLCRQLCGICRFVLCAGSYRDDYDFL